MRSDRGEQGIRIDWEHEDWAWYDPFQVNDSESFGGVPRLTESLRRVFFELEIGKEAGEVLSAGLERLQNDHQSGARQLAGAALQILRDVVEEVEPTPASLDWWATVRSVAWHIWKNGRESMGAAIMSVLMSALRRIDHQRAAVADASLWKQGVLQVLDELIALRGAESANRISGALVKYLEMTFEAKLMSKQPLSVLTLSESSTVVLGLRHLLLDSGFSLDLRVLESRPLFEGVSMAGSLVRELQSPTAVSKVKVTLYPDAAVALAAQGVDLVLIGADRIAQSGAVSNKTGSLPAILSSRHVATSAGSNLKVAVLAESEKVAPPADPALHVVEDNDPEQLIRTWRGAENSERIRDAVDSILGVDEIVSIRNIFFEWCPSDLIDVYITELGLWTVDDVAQHSDLLGAEQKRLFGDL